jgi:pyruvate formate lyase activating enzyme
MNDVPGTGVESLRRGLKAGRDAGLKYVYAGNIPGESENTVCSVCGEELIERLGYRIMRNSVIDGHCRKCGSALAGIWG